MGARWRPYERDLRAAGHAIVAGLDEVGRGPLAGPVVACAIVMPADGRRLAGVDDSKALSPETRERLARAIRASAVAVGVGAASVREIDRLNILHATTLAMRRALARLAPRADHVVLDGRPMPTLGTPHLAVVKGDATCYSVACASIVAKVLRDALMARLARRYPAYAWDRNVGYGTAVHLAALQARGATPHHRRSFAPVAQLELV
ncbi:MAG: ribonuclease HII [Gemmatimonadaceae bacterium]|nr:ribonuclease HII [Gemmatimonadaceae bacterium]